MRTLVIIKNRNVGFFSVLLQIMNTLMLIKNHPNYIPIIELTNKWGYGNKCIWNHFFEQLIPFNLNTDKLESDKIIYTDEYYPQFVKKNEKFPGHALIPTKEQRLLYSDLFKSFIFLKSNYKMKFDNFFEKNLMDVHTIIGINFRGTDSRDDPRRITPEYSIYINYIENIKKEKKIDNFKIFCTSDEIEFIRFIYDNYRNNTYYNPNLFIGCKNTRGSQNIDDYDCPSYIINNGIKSLEGALFDYYILTKCQYLIYLQGSIPLTVLLTNPDIIPINVKEGGYIT